MNIIDMVDKLLMVQDTDIKSLRQGIDNIEMKLLSHEGSNSAKYNFKVERLVIDLVRITHEIPDISDIRHILKAVNVILLNATKYYQDDGHIKLTNEEDDVYDMLTSRRCF